MFICPDSLGDSHRGNNLFTDISLPPLYADLCLTISASNRSQSEPRAGYPTFGHIYFSVEYPPFLDMGVRNVGRGSLAAGGGSYARGRISGKLRFRRQGHYSEE